MVRVTRSVRLGRCLLVYALLSNRRLTAHGSTMHDLRFSRRLYTAADAARFVGMSQSTLRAWTRGYKSRSAARPAERRGPVVTALGAEGSDRRSIPFIGLVEAAVVQAFRRTGLPMQRIRRALEVLSEQGELQHALASKKLYSDGADILYDYAQDHDDKQLRLLTLVSTGQRVFHEVITDYLDRIEFGDMWASGIVLPVTQRRLLRVVPEVASGHPLFVHGGAPLSAVRSRFLAGEPILSLARDYEVPAEDIEEVNRAIWPEKAAA